MRLLAVALIVTIALITTTGCWLEADDADGADEERSELREYAAAMRVWWLEVHGGEPPLLPLSLAIDHARILDDPAAGYHGTDPLPSVDPPRVMGALHELLVSSVIAVAKAESAAERAGFVAGLAAAFCDPSSVDTVLWPQAAALQNWRWEGESCRDGDRWVGNWRPEGAPADLWRDFQWRCPADDLWLFFSVSSRDLEIACENVDAWERIFDTVGHAWSAELVRRCSEQVMVRPDPADALAACE